MDEDFGHLDMCHEDGRSGRIHRQGEHHGFDVPYVIIPRSSGSDVALERRSGIPFRNITEILTAGWLVAQRDCGLPTSPEDITLLDVE